MRKTILLPLLAFLLLFGCKSGPKTSPVAAGMDTYCNPLDLDYGWGTFKANDPDARTSADPVIVLFKGKYYLFATHDIGGYRVSDDLLDWKNVYFNEEVHDAALNYGSYVAPGVAADENYMYFVKLNRDRSQKTVQIVRSADPENGHWEVFSEIPRVSDPTIFIDNGRYFIFHGLGTDQSIKSFELDPQTLTKIPGSDRDHLYPITDVKTLHSGYHFGRREIWDEVDTGEWKGKFEWLPCPEGAWIINRNGRYYLQYATPGTLSIWYSDVVMESDQPDRGFVEMPYNPVSLKVGGFIGSAGHSSVFEDKYGNWWQITTMWVGNHNPFERRLGLFPVTFDKEGRMRVHTLLGDYPMILPQKKLDAGHLAGWWCVSNGKECTASSTLEGFPPQNASDENVRTWWSAASGEPGEWFQMDLGGRKSISAVQLNFGEQDFDRTSTQTEDYTAYVLYYSADGENWTELINRKENTRTNPHEYVVLDSPVDAAYVKIVNHHAMGKGKFAIRDLRLFGHAYGSAPSQTEAPSIERDSEDGRFATVGWTPVDDADGYLVRFGITPQFLNQTIQVKGRESAHLDLHILTKGVKYYFQVDTYNENGMTEGKITKDAK